MLSERLRLSHNGGTRGSPPIIPRDTVSRIANVGTVGKNGLSISARCFRGISGRFEWFAKAFISLYIVRFESHCVQNRIGHTYTVGQCRLRQNSVVHKYINQIIGEIKNTLQPQKFHARKTSWKYLLLDEYMRQKIIIEYNAVTQIYRGKYMLTHNIGYLATATTVASSN